MQEFQIFVIRLMNHHLMVFMQIQLEILKDSQVIRVLQLKEFGIQFIKRIVSVLPNYSNLLVESIVAQLKYHKHHHHQVYQLVQEVVLVVEEVQKCRSKLMMTVKVKCVSKSVYIINLLVGCIHQFLCIYAQNGLIKKLENGYVLIYYSHKFYLL